MHCINVQLFEDPRGIRQRSIFGHDYAYLISRDDAAARTNGPPLLPAVGFRPLSKVYKPQLSNLGCQHQFSTVRFSKHHWT